MGPKNQGREQVAEDKLVRTRDDVRKQTRRPRAKLKAFKDTKHQATSDLRVLWGHETFRLVDVVKATVDTITDMVGIVAGPLLAERLRNRAHDIRRRATEARWREPKQEQTSGRKRQQAEAPDQASDRRNGIQLGG